MYHFSSLGNTHPGLLAKGAQLLRAYLDWRNFGGILESIVPLEMKPLGRLEQGKTKFPSGGKGVSCVHFGGKKAST